MQGLYFYFDQHFESIALLPCLCVTIGKCECCDEPGAVLLHVDFLCWTVGIAFEFYTHPKP